MKNSRRRPREGIYPPFEVVKDTTQGFIVKATNDIPLYSLISEYSGKVVEHTEELKSDAIMDSLSIETSSFVICPDLTGNLARFISGINNKDKKAKKKEC